jgi:hypothetical protein
MMHRWLLSVFGASLLAGGLMACTGSPASTTAPTATPSVTVSSVTVTGAAPVSGAAAQFAATATMSNGTTQTVTSQASWQSSNAAVATVNSGGVVTFRNLRGLQGFG